MVFRTVCPYCGYSTRFLKLIIRHYIQEHESDSNFNIMCGIDNCLSSYHNPLSLKKHILRKHSDAVKLGQNRNGNECVSSVRLGDSVGLISDIEQDTDVKPDGVSVSDGTDFQILEDESESERQTKKDAEYDILKFVLNLRVKKCVTEQSTEYIIQKFENLITDCIDQTQNSLNNIEEELGNLSISTICNPLKKLQSNLLDFNTVYKQNQRLQQDPFVAPISINDNLSDGDSVIYIPIIETLKSLLKHEDIISFVTKPHSNINSDIISDYSSCNRFQNSFFSRKNTISIQLYIDDFTLSNPLGTSAKKHKICALYFSIGNIPYKLRSKLYTIQLVSLFPSRLVKKYGFTILLSKFISDLKSLETNGIEVDTSCGIQKFYGSIHLLVADNLAAHEIGGFVTSFSAFRRCRFCNVTSDTLQLHFHERDFELRNSESYDAQVQHVINDPQLSTIYGIKNSCVLNELTYFHVCWSSPSDIAHDLFEGFCRDLLKVVLDHCLNLKLFSIDFLNLRISQFPYAGKDSTNKPSNISGVNTSATKVVIKQTAAECHNLVSLLPLLVAHKIPITDPYWLCYLSFLNCLDYILAPSLNVGQIKYMEELITDFISMYKNLDDNIHIKPKLHFMIHYATQYLLFGPLINLSTLRYEGVHSKLKTIFNSCKNYKNPCLTIATRYQYLQSLHSMNSEFLLENEVKFSKKSNIKYPSDLGADISEHLEELGHSCPIPSITTTEWVEYCGIKYEKGTVVIIGFDYEYQFAIIENATSIKGHPYLIVQMLDIIEFNTHIHSYILKRSEDHCLIKISDLLSPNALPAYKTELNELVVRMRHLVVDTRV